MENVIKTTFELKIGSSDIITMMQCHSYNTIQYNTVIYIAPFQVTLLKALFSSRTN
jgi:hypothetical protein